ncbi:hypothetical protein HYR69_07290, partial [Candidatus Sumerlaeota bacterium]|nr:hypothetical protein [Candidatus Sumerlaeota bacterium]
MTSPWRDLIAYAEFLRDAGNVFVEAPPGKELPVFPPKSPPASFSPAVPHRPVSAPPRHVPAPAAASATRPAVPPRRAAEPMPQPDLHNIVSSRTPLSSVILSELERETKVAEAKEAVASCMACELCKTRTNTVYGSGSLMAKIAFVGEAPGEEEDRQGLPFVGRAGQLLTKMIESIGFKREEVYICNTLKCRPPGNRDPLPHEKQACQP